MFELLCHATNTTGAVPLGDLKNIFISITHCRVSSSKGNTSQGEVAVMRRSCSILVTLVIAITNNISQPHHAFERARHIAAASGRESRPLRPRTYLRSNSRFFSITTRHYKQRAGAMQDVGEGMGGQTSSRAEGQKGKTVFFTVLNATAHGWQGDRYACYCV